MSSPNQPEDYEGAGRSIRFLLYLVIGLIVVIGSVSRCVGAEITVGWEANPEPYVLYRVYRVSDTPPALITITFENSVRIVAEHGDMIAVAAYNGEESDLSDSVAAPAPNPLDLPPPPTPEPAMVKVHVYQMTDLKTRKVLATIYVEKKDKDFFQLGIETP